MTPLINTAQPNPAPIGVPGVAQAGNALSPQGTMQAAPMQQTPTASPTAPMGAAGTVTPPAGNTAPQGDVAGFIQQARAQNVPDEQIFNYLHQNGMIPTNAVVQQGQQQQGAQLNDTGSFGGNLLNSSGQFVKNLAGAVGNIFNPNPEKNTLVNVGKVVGGLAEEVPVLAHNLITGKGPDDAGGWSVNDKPYQNLIDSLNQRYGSWDNVKKTAYQDPVGFLADAASVVSGAGEALSTAGKVSDISKLSEFGANITKVADAVNPVNAITKPVEMASSLAKAGLQKLGPAIEDSNLRLTPVQRAANAGKLADVTDYISKNIPAGSPESRFEAAAANVDTFENQLQTYFDGAAKDVTVPKQTVLNEAEALKSQFKNDRDSLAINRQIDDFKSNVDANYPDANGTFNPDGSPVSPEIHVGDLNQLKRSTFANAFNQAGTKVSDAVEFKLGDMLKSQIEQATAETPVLGKYPIAKVNEAYGIALTAKKLLKYASGRPQVGFLTKLLSDAIGLGTGGPVAAAATHFVEANAPITAAKSLVGKAARGVANTIPKIKVPNGVTAAANAGSRVNTYSKIKKP